MNKHLLQAAIAFAALTTAAFGIQPQQWTDTTEADFEKGETQDTVVTNLGDVKLATASEVIGEMPKEASIIYDMLAEKDGTLLLAAGPEAKLLRRKGKNIEQVLTLTDEQIFCLDRFDGKLLVGVSGEETSRLAVLDGKELKTLVELPETRYVWDLLIDGKVIYAATGTEGALLKIDTAAEGEGRVTTVLDASQTNLLCLARDGQGRLYAGSDTDGLVYRLTPNGNGKFDTYVLYDADEPEVGALLVREDGTVFAGTADAEQARPGRLEKPRTSEEGRPQVPDVDPGDLPNVPPKPEPTTDAAKPAPAADAAKPADAPAPNTEAEPADAPAPDAQAAAGNQPPTQEQFDTLRAEIRSRLEKARETGEMQAGAMMQPRQSGGTTSSSRRSTSSGGAKKQGNAVYRIDPSGFVSEVFRESAMILRIIDAGDGRLLVATGNEGQLFRVDPAAEETTIVADLEPQQIPTAVVGPDGQIVLGTANPASLVRLSETFAKNGTYISQVRDASQVSLWGVLHVGATVPKGATLSIETRSGNVGDPDQAAWSKWSASAELKHDPDRLPLTPYEIKIDSPPARFLQYRVTLKAGGDATPVLDRVELAYVVPNMKPVVKSIKAEYPDAKKAGSGSSGTAAAPAELTKLTVQWEAEDPNGDDLKYTLEAQPAGSSNWLPLVEDTTEKKYEWDTRRVPDGRYLLRIRASDAPDNPGSMAIASTRQSNPIVVDNTPPTLEKLTSKLDNGGVTITGTARDALSTVREIHYALDSTEDWQLVLPDDLIFDSTTETFTVKVPDLAPGPHVVTLRATDTLGNAHYRAIQVEVK